MVRASGELGAMSPVRPKSRPASGPASRPGRRVDGRRAAELRPVSIRRGYLKNAEGSALIEMGGTRVLCAATVEERVPPWLRGGGRGWITAEYSMLPRSSHDRIQREVNRGHVGGRTQEIQRLIGRSLRAVANLEALGERQILIDCDVIEADGGTRTASITGAFIALADAIRWLSTRVKLPGPPLRDFVAAVSVGLVNGTPSLDLCYAEDSKAQVDMNLVMTGAGRLVEIQGTAEGEAFSERELAQLIGLGKAGIRRLIAEQRKVLGIRTLPKTWA
ncbi:MAG TPA: ribonuclease PH [Candidatus Omnitrophota bacterium]|nr:ribonuclease PH [Candidatus Omnitrophota bacterium]